jgi:DNA-binding NarL/FixJ family response regulator
MDLDEPDADEAARRSPRRLVLAVRRREPVLPDGLSPAEADVARLIFDGLSNAEVAERRGTSVRTVAKQVSAVLRKTGTQSRVELVLSLLGVDGPG